MVIDQFRRLPAIMSKSWYRLFQKIYCPDIQRCTSFRSHQPLTSFKKTGIVVGIKVDTGIIPLPGTDDEGYTMGLNDL